MELGVALGERASSMISRPQRPANIISVRVVKRPPSERSW